MKAKIFLLVLVVASVVAYISITEASLSKNVRYVGPGKFKDVQSAIDSLVKKVDLSDKNRGVVIIMPGDWIGNFEIPRFVTVRGFDWKASFIRAEVTVHGQASLENIRVFGNIRLLNSKNGYWGLKDIIAVNGLGHNSTINIVAEQDDANLIGGIITDSVIGTFGSHCIVIGKDSSGEGFGVVEYFFRDTQFEMYTPNAVSCLKMTKPSLNTRSKGVTWQVNHVRSPDALALDLYRSNFKSYQDLYEHPWNSPPSSKFIRIDGGGSLARVLLDQSAGFRPSQGIEIDGGIIKIV